MTTEIFLQPLIHLFMHSPRILSVGLSSGEEPLPKAGEGDLDVFVYCDNIPEESLRQSWYKNLPTSFVSELHLTVFEHPFWGIGDSMRLNGVETWIMYFVVEEEIRYVQEILHGNHLQKTENYNYPVGRCAMFQKMKPLLDKNGFLSGMKELVAVYPDSLAQRMLEFHSEQLRDTEDLERAVARKDVLFYHFALDLALDHFLLALFGLNRVYFPSRKRSLDDLSTFQQKPVRCEERLLHILHVGALPETLGESFYEWTILVQELYGFL